MNNIDDLKNSIPDYAKDIRLNLTSLITNSEYDDDIVYGCAYSSSLAADCLSELSAVFENECRLRISDSFIESVKSTVTIMTLNNIWYKYRDAMPISEMKTAAQRMRVNVMINHGGLDKIIFESLSLCISAVNGCNFCVKAHSALLLDNGQSKDYILMIGRIASVILAIDKALRLK
ncbi:MAG: hypothetical protein CMG74_09250 [Candidatus Marinimicrobia bacterium]|nr:hypothetical protein [Candidatus Neomarinimicrobiota bacterium]